MKDCEDTQQLKCEHRLTALETLIDRIVDNDLPHIQRWVIAVFIAVVVSAIGAFIRTLAI